MIAILDFGSQYTQLIAKKLRAHGYISEVFPGPPLSLTELKGKNPSGVILSGSPWSVGQGHDPQDEIFDVGVPILGLCFGYQSIALKFGGSVGASTLREYGRAVIEVVEQDPLLQDFSSGSSVWMSHGDSVLTIPPTGRLLLKSGGKMAGFVIPSKKVWALQFHPEVHHTPEGGVLLENFAKNICGMKPLWNQKSILEKAEKAVLSETHPNDEIYCAVSGGVDSTVLAALISKHRKVTALFVDHGFLREYDESDLRSVFRDFPNIQLKVISAKDVFWSELDGVEDPETKRKKAGKLFIECFDSAVQSSAKKPVLAQGTIYSDVIESAGDGTSSSAHKIKSHHNVGGMPKEHKFKIFEPLRELFKDEVRLLGRALGISQDFLDRHPFPGPGLMIRHLGPLRQDSIELLRRADQVFIEELKKRDLYRKTWQAFCVLLPVKSVGVMGDGRSFEKVLALRIVDSFDAMTAEVSELPWKDLKEISSRLINEVKGINRVVLDLTSKPPGTIEWE